ncbi:Spindle assembly abnormal protein [Dirofilaria immitis]
MSSDQPDCLTSLVSYIPELNLGLNIPSTGTVNQFGISSTNQVQQLVPLLPELSLPLESVSARNCDCKCIFQRKISPQPLRPALKKTSLTKSWNEVEEKLKKRDREEKQISNPKRPTDAEAKAEKHQPFPARLLQKKKTVAFGRTVNLSQTIEGTSRAHRKFSAVSNSQKRRFPKMATVGQNERLLDEFEKLKEKVHEMQLKIDELTAKDSERSSQLLQLTETMKKILVSLVEFNILSNDIEDSKTLEKKDGTEVRCRGKENIPPKKKYVAECLNESSEGNPVPVSHEEFFAKTKKKIIGGSSKEDVKWIIMKRKYAENEEFKRLVDEAIMKFGGDESLDIFASDQNKRDSDRIRPLCHEKKTQPISPVIRSTTRVTKHMTVEQIERCENSPASCAFSYDSKKYLARHGIIPEFSDDSEVEHKMAFGKQLDSSVQSYYHPGNSVTYYSKNIKCSNVPLKGDSCLNLSRNRTSHNNYREERHYHEEERPPRAVFDGINYQMDQFDTDDDENVNNIIEISNGLEVEDHCGTNIKIRSPQNTRGWKDSSRIDFRLQKNDGIYQHMKQRFSRLTLQSNNGW